MDEEERKLRAFNEEMDENAFVVKDPTAPTMQQEGNNPANMTKTDEENVISQYTTQQAPPPSGLSTSYGACPECGTMHPPVAPGAKCPVAPQKTETGQVINFEEFFAKLKNILMSQIDEKKLVGKDVEKLMTFTTMKIMEILENYGQTKTEVEYEFTDSKE